MCKNRNNSFRLTATGGKKEMNRTEPILMFISCAVGIKKGHAGYRYSPNGPTI